MIARPDPVSLWVSLRTHMARLWGVPRLSPVGAGDSVRSWSRGYDRNSHNANWPSTSVHMSLHRGSGLYVERAAEQVMIAPWCRPCVGFPVGDTVDTASLPENLDTEVIWLLRYCGRIAPGACSKDRRKYLEEDSQGTACEPRVPWRSS